MLFNLSHYFVMADQDKDKMMTLQEFSVFLQIQRIAHGAGDIQQDPCLNEEQMKAKLSTWITEELSE